MNEVSSQTSFTTYLLKKKYLNNIKTMSEKSKVKRARREAEQEKKGKKVVNWIFGVLIVLAICYMIYVTILAS